MGSCSSSINWIERKFQGGDIFVDSPYVDRKSKFDRLFGGRPEINHRKWMALERLFLSHKPLMFTTGSRS